MDLVRNIAGKFTGIFGLTDAFQKEHSIQKQILGATILNTLVLTLTLIVYQEVSEDITLRIYFSQYDTKRRCSMAAIIWLGLWAYIVHL